MMPMRVGKTIAWHVVAGLSVCTALAGCLQTPEAPKSDWVDMFDAKSLAGWTQVNGAAPYEIVEGAIRGTNVLDSPNSFLATENQYSDFVLEFESRSVGEANSGVQFRTDLAPGTWSGVVGYQLDIDPSARRWTGGIYHEGVHVWRHAMARNVDCQASYRHGEWNSYRVEAVGSVIATWVNGVACAHMVGDHHDTGLIALQVHSIGQEADYLGSYTEWRKLRVLNDPKAEELWLDRRNPLVEGWLETEISEIELEAGWRAVDFSDASAVLDGSDHGVEFVIDLQVGEGAEAHFAYASQSAGGACLAAYKILDDSTVGQSRPDVDLTGSLAGKLAANNLSEPGRPKRFYPDNRWNRIRLIITADTVEHWLNSVKVVEYARCAPALTRPDLKPDPAHPDRIRLDLVRQSGQITTRNAKFRALKPAP